jgi:hypothetical protein
MKEPAELLIPQTGTFTLDQMKYIRDLAAGNKWSVSETIRVLCEAGRKELERRALDAERIASGSTQVDPDFFKAGA